MKKKNHLTIIASILIASIVFITCKKDNFVERVGLCEATGQYTVVLSSSPIAGGTTTGAGLYNAGATATIKATPSNGYTFTSWTGDTTSILSTLSVLVDKNKNIVANFTLNSVNCPTVVDLKSAKTYTVLAKAGISATGVTSIVGDIGVDPVTSTSITGFGLILPAGGAFSTSSLVAGKVYASDYAVPTPANILTARLDMETAYTVANGMTAPAPTVGLGAGNITGLTLTPGIYKWSTGLLVSNPGVTLDSKGDNCGTFIFQIAQDLTVGPGAKVILAGGTQAKNIFWIVAGGATLNTTADFSGNILSKTLISLKTGAKVTGRLFAQTAVTLDGGSAVKPE
jgi:uncharacterized repeat protein (TIGR02543 family)